MMLTDRARVRLRRELHSRMLSLRALGPEIGVAPTTLARWLAGGRVHPQSQRALIAWAKGRGLPARVGVWLEDPPDAA